ncbi:MAG: zinc ribbon domain-containing protein [Patescibacteria group bacterium]
MSLIKCIECGKEISDHAGACPSCGNPIHAQVVELKKPIEPVEIELTSKKWKTAALWSIFFLAVAFFTFFKSVGLGFFFLFVAFVIGIVSRIGAWWTNG